MSFEPRSPGNFDFKSPVNPQAEAQLMQRKAEVENAQKAKSQENAYTAITDAVKTASDTVTKMVQRSKEAQRNSFVKTLADSLASTGALKANGSAMFGGSKVPTASFNPDQNDAIKAAVMLNPEQATKDYLEAQIPKTPTRSPFQAKTIGVKGPDGQVNAVEAVFNPDTLQWLKAGTNEPITGEITQAPSANNVPGELTDADRKRLTPLAKAVVEGRATPTALVNARGSEKEKLALLASELDPQFDLSLAPQRITTRKDFSSAGKSGQSISSLNTAIGHLDSLYENGQKLGNTEIQLWNKFKNSVSKHTGSPAVDRMLADRDAVTSELGKVFQGTGVVTQSEKDEFRARMNEASSPEQIKAVSDEWINLLKSRTDTFKANWQQSMGGTETPIPIINEKSKKALIKHGYDPVTMEKKQAETADATDDSQLHALASVLKLPRKK